MSRSIFHNEILELLVDVLRWCYQVCSCLECSDVLNEARYYWLLLERNSIFYLFRVKLKDFDNRK